MKLVRFGTRGLERPGMVAPDGSLRDLSRVVPDIAGITLRRDGLDRLRQIDPMDLPLIPEGAPLSSCVPPPINFIGIGRNYAEHAAETGAETPKEPLLFNKAPTSIAGPYDDIVLPPEASKTDWEVELGVVICQRSYRVAEERALDHIAGYCLVNDVSDRGFQFDSTGQYVKGKSLPTFGPVGPWLVTQDEIANVQALGLWLDLNGERMQAGTTADMVHSVVKLVSYITHFMELMPGDVISTGTPAGVGHGMTPPRYLQPGDDLAFGIDGLGEQRHRVAAYA
ncbi:MAG: fumarylacetoacetate hydrolase family protein [Pseudomonadota bacterium]